MIVGGVMEGDEEVHSLTATHRWRRTFDEGAGGTGRNVQTKYGGRGW